MIRVMSMALLCLSLIFGVAQAQEGQPVFRIGVLDDERGAISNGARLAVREINELGGAQGAEGTLFRLELVIQPSGEGETLEGAIDVIRQARVIAVLGPETTDQVLSNLPLLQKPNLEVPVLTPALGDTIIASDSSGNLYRIRAVERLLGRALADYLVNDLQAISIATVQLDRKSTAGRVGFSVALSQLGGGVTETTFLLDERGNVLDLVGEVINSQVQHVVVYGAPDLAADFYNQLRSLGWVGEFVYERAFDPVFRGVIPLSQLQGIISATTWAVSSQDAASRMFVNSYVRGYGQAPAAIEAAAYDAIHWLAVAIGKPGNLQSNLANTRDLGGVQGTLNPSGLTRGELTHSVAVIQLNSLGGPEVAARYSATQRVEVVKQTGDERSMPTPTPDGVVLTIKSAVQNVRTGPGLAYEVLGQLREGEQARIVGANTDFSWVVIQYRGQEGWLATYLLDVFGDRSTMPVIAAPPTPTPPPATATPTLAPIPDIIITSASPANLTLGSATLVNVGVRNAGGGNAGPFAVAATFLPDNVFSSVALPGLNPGAEAMVQLPVILNGATGNYSVTIVADLNNQVNEGGNGEQNNASYVFNYKLDRQLILINSTTLLNGNSIDLEGNVNPQLDLQYTGAGLNTTGACNGTANCISVLSSAFNWDTTHYDLIGGVSGTLVENAAIQPGTTMGVLTAEGRRAVLRVDAITPGTSITFTYRVYQ